MGSGAGVFARWANLPVQTQLLVLLRNPVDALLLLALRCAAQAQAGPRCLPPANSILHTSVGEGQALPWSGGEAQHQLLGRHWESGGSATTPLQLDARLHTTSAKQFQH